MKIGLICPYNIFKGGGVQECVLALQAELVKRGHTAQIITPRPRDVPDKVPQFMTLVGAATDIKSPFHTTAQVSVSVDTAELEDFLDAHKFDILHFHEPWVPILSRQILSRSSAVNIATFHAKLPETVMSRTIERVITPYTRSILKYIDEFTAVSDAAAAYLASLTKSPIAIVPNGIDLKKYTSRKKPLNKTSTLLYIGRLEKRKGVKYLLDAFSLLKRSVPDARLIVAGDGPDREKLILYTKEQRISDVEFVGYVDEAAKLVLLESTDLFCSLALYGESFGIVLLEAMAKGAVTVAGNNPGYTNVLTGRGALSVVDPKNAPEVARRLELLLEDDELRALWQRWAKEYVKQFGYKRIAGQYIEIYEQGLKDSKKK